MKGYKDLSALSFLTRKVYVVPYLRTTPHGQAIKRPISTFIMRIGTDGFLTRGKNRKNPFKKGERNLLNGEGPASCSSYVSIIQHEDVNPDWMEYGVLVPPEILTVSSVALCFFVVCSILVQL